MKIILICHGESEGNVLHVINDDPSRAVNLTARGADGLEFPWGNDRNISKTNTGDDSNVEEGYAPVGAFPQNKSPYVHLFM